MKDNLKITILFLAFLCSSQVEAQFFKKLQERIENKIERKLEKKADKKADQALDSVFADRPSKRKQPKKNNSEEEASTEISGFDLGGMMESVMNRKPAQYESSYTFNLTTTMEVTSQGSKPMTMTTSYGDGAHFIQMDNGTSIINDYKNEAMITINEEKKTAQAMSLGLMKLFEQKEDVIIKDASDIEVSKTGNTKTISGYNCYQYIITGNDFKTDGWFTKDINFDIIAHAQSMSEMFKSVSSEAIMNKKIGFPMEMNTTTKQNEQVLMKVRDVSEQTKTIDLSGYNVSQL